MSVSHLSRARRRTGFKPSLEALENRTCPSASIQILPGAMILHGDGAADQMTVVDDGHGGVTASIVTPTGTVNASASGIRSIKYDVGAGNDTISFSLSGQLTTALNLKVNLEQGNDQATLDFSQGIAGHSPAKTLLDADVDGDTGQDQVTTTFGAVSDAGVSYEACMGAGSSTAAVQFNGALTSANVALTVAGNTGSQKMTVGFGAIQSSTVGLTEYLGNGTTSSSSVTFGGTISASHTSVKIDGGTASDTIGVTFGEIDGGTVKVTEWLGDGATTSDNLTFSGPLNGTALSATVGGGQASDTIAITFGAINGGSIDLDNYLGKGANTTSNVAFTGAISGATISADLDAGTPTATATGTHGFVFQLGSVTNSRVSVAGCLGTGTASFEADLTGSLQDSTVKIAGNGKGTDQYTYNAKGVNVDAGSELDLHAGSGKADVNTSLTYEGVVAGKLNIDLNGGPTGNTESANVTLDAGSTGAVAAHERGGAGNDNLTLNVYDDSGGKLSSLVAVLNGEGGQDMLTHTSNVKVK
jgi:hypothetical protein